MLELEATSRLALAVLDGGLFAGARLGELAAALAEEETPISSDVVEDASS